MRLTVLETRDCLDREWSRFLDHLQTAGEQGWRRPTRCAGWTVADLAAHALWGTTMEADALRRVRDGGPGHATGRVVDASTDRRAVLAELRQAHADLVTEVGRLAGTDLTLSAPMPYGDVPVDVLLDVYAMEAGIHGSDLADAVGEAPALSLTVARATESFLHMFLPVLAQPAPNPPSGSDSFLLAGDRVRIGGRWAAGALVLEPPDVPAVTVEGDDTAVLLFAMGRVPASHPRLRVDGDQHLAGDLKTYLPGP
jgi:uncharacterized protein (TIGR03083 family)